MGSCMGGADPRFPQRWVQWDPDGNETERVGRVDGCGVNRKGTSLKYCHGCPAYRGVDRDGIEWGMTYPDGEPRLMTGREHDAWQEDPDAFWAAHEGGGWSMRFSGTLEWDEWWAGWMRDYRARMSEEQRDRHREQSRERMRRMRQRRREGCYVRAAERNIPERFGITEPHDGAGARARRSTYVTPKEAR
jgi:hypothetical protein